MLLWLRGPSLPAASGLLSKRLWTPSMHICSAGINARRCVPDLEADKLGPNGCVDCAHVSQGCHGRLYQHSWSAMHPQHTGLGCSLSAPWLSCDLADILIGECGAIRSLLSFQERRGPLSDLHHVAEEPLRCFFHADWYKEFQPGQCCLVEFWRHRLTPLSMRTDAAIRFCHTWLLRRIKTKRLWA